MTTGTGPEVQKDVNGASPHLLAGQERDWLYRHGRTHVSGAVPVDCPTPAGGGLGEPIGHAGWWRNLTI